MKTRNKVLILASVFILGFISSFTPILASADIEYTFESDVMYTNDALGYSEYNLRDDSEFTQTYNASYSFTNEVDGTTNETIDFITTMVYDGHANIKSDIDGHSKVINLTAPTGWGSFQNVFSDQTDGEVEFFIRPAQSNHRLMVGLSDASGLFAYPRAGIEFDATGWIEVEGSNKIQYSANTWYHVRFVFDVSTHWHVYINGEQLADAGGFGYTGAITEINMFQIGVLGIANLYLDAVGYSWDPNYDITDNILPIRVVNSSFMGADTFDFRFEGIDNLCDVGDDNVNGWTDIEIGGDYVNIAVDPNQPLDFSIFMDLDGFDDGTVGIEKDFAISSARFIEVSSETYIQSMTEDGAYTIEIYSSDSTLIAKYGVKVDDPFPANEYDIYYYDGGSDVVLYADIGAGTGGTFKFYSYIDYSSDTIYLHAYRDDVYVDSYLFPLIATGKDGLEKVKCLSFIGAGVLTNDIYLDWIGVYVNDITLTEEFGYLNSGYLNNPYWYFEEYNLFSFNGSGTYSVNVCPLAYLPDITPLYEYLALDTYYNEDIFTNSFDFTVTGDSFITLPTFVIIIYNGSARFTDVLISGIKLDDGTTEYYPTYNSGGVSNEKSYWWVEDEELHYALTCDDNNTEFLNIAFNIDDLTTYNNTFIYEAYSFNLFGRELRLNYLSSTTSIIDIAYGHRVERVYFPPEEIFKTFDILITDDDYYDNYTDTGYITDVLIQSSSTHGIAISTSNFLTALTPLLFFILIPSMLIIYTLDKQDVDDDTREKMFMPIFAVFCFVAFVFSQIDLWQLFIMIMGFIPLFLSLSGED